MSMYTDAERRAIFDESRRHLKEAEKSTGERLPARTERREDILASLPPVEDSMTRWRREAAEQEARKAAYKTECKAKQDAAVRAEREHQIALVRAQAEAQNP